jgi:MoaA/NifB/PqqE/SkfB family radical SAM enzyme
MPYLTWAKLLNMTRCELEKWRRLARPRAFPYVAVIDVAHSCNLRCPYCPTGAGRKSGRGRRMIDPLLVTKTLDELDKYLLSAVMYNWGEPLLHPQLPGIVRIIHERRIFTAISTNLSISNKEALAELCEASLDHLTVSLSGATQEVYARYHGHGDLALVLENIRYLASYKKRNRL